MPNSLQDSRKQIIALDQCERVLEYLESITSSLADVRTQLPGEDSIASRRTMSEFLTNEIDLIKRLRHNEDARRPGSIDDPG